MVEPAVEDLMSTFDIPDAKIAKAAAIVTTDPTLVVAQDHATEIVPESDVAGVLVPKIESALEDPNRALAIGIAKRSVLVPEIASDVAPDHRVLTGDAGIAVTVAAVKTAAYLGKLKLKRSPRKRLIMMNTVIRVSKLNLRTANPWDWLTMEEAITKKNTRLKKLQEETKQYLGKWFNFLLKVDFQQW